MNILNPGKEESTVTTLINTERTRHETQVVAIEKDNDNEYDYFAPDLFPITRILVRLIQF